MSSSIRENLILLLFGIGLTATTWGLFHLSRSDIPGSLFPFFFRYPVLVVFFFAVIMGGAILTKQSPWGVFSVVSVGIGVAAGAVGPILFMAAFALSSMVIGENVCRFLSGGLRRESGTVVFLVGAGIYGTVIGFFARFPVHFAGVYSGLLLCPLLFGWRCALEWGRTWGSHFRDTTVSQKKKRRWLDGCLFSVFLVYIVVAFLPELGSDALAVHLFIPGQLAQNHCWTFDVGKYVWAVMPMLGDWVYSIGFVLAGETGTRLLNVVFLFSLVKLIRDMVLWAGGSSVGAKWGALVFLSTPLVFTEGSSLFVETVWGAFVVAGAFRIAEVLSDPAEKGGGLPVTGLLLGMALSAKIISLMVFPALFTLLVLKFRSKPEWKFINKNVAWAAILCLSVGCIPYVRAWWLTGNPLFPFYNHIFKSSLFPIEKFNNALFNSPLGWNVLYNLAFRADLFLESYVGGGGFQWVILFTPSLALLLLFPNVRGMQLVFLGAVPFFLTFVSQSYVRYVFPSFVFFSGVFGLVLSELNRRSPGLRWAGNLAFAATFLINGIFFTSASFYRDVPFMCVFSKREREAFIRSRFPIRQAVELLNIFNVAREPVAVFAPEHVAGLAADALFTNWYNSGFQTEINKCENESDLVKSLLKRRVDFVLLSRTWGTPSKRALIERVTNVIYDFGGVAVRGIKPEYRFSQERLRNPEFKETEGWMLSPGCRWDPFAHILRVSGPSPATQVLPVLASRGYRAVVESRCAGVKTQGRLQVNWSDAKMNFLRADIDVFECSEAWKEYSMSVVSPEHAANAIVYASGHTADFLEFKRVSFQ